MPPEIDMQYLGNELLKWTLKIIRFSFSLGIPLQSLKWNNFVFCAAFSRAGCQVFSVHPRRSFSEQFQTKHLYCTSLISYQWINTMRSGVILLPRAVWLHPWLLLRHWLHHGIPQVLTFCPASHIAELYEVSTYSLFIPTKPKVLSYLKGIWGTSVLCWTQVVCLC